jgi:hypothetical protein
MDGQEGSSAEPAGTSCSRGGNLEGKRSFVRATRTTESLDENSGERERKTVESREVEVQTDTLTPEAARPQETDDKDRLQVTSGSEAKEKMADGIEEELLWMLLEYFVDGGSHFAVDGAKRCFGYVDDEVLMTNFLYARKRLWAAEKMWRSRFTDADGLPHEWPTVELDFVMVNLRWL